MKLVYTEPARQRLTDIEDYTTAASSETKARKLIDGLLAKALCLRDHPLRGIPEPRLAKRGQGHRCLVAGRFKIVYFVVDGTIHITDFFDTKQHPSRMRG